MGKIKIVVGKHCLEQSKIILSLCPKCELFTTDFVVADGRCVYPNSVQVVNLSPEEICQYFSFYDENECLQKIGYIEGSLLFVALRRGCKVAVLDMVTKEVCEVLGISILYLKQERSQIEGFRIQNLRNSRLSKFIKAVCF